MLILLKLNQILYLKQDLLTKWLTNIVLDNLNYKLELSNAAIKSSNSSRANKKPLPIGRGFNN